MEKLMKQNRARKVKTEEPAFQIIEKASPEVATPIMGIKPYDPVSSRTKMVRRPEMEHFKLDWNESTIPPSPRVRKAILDALDDGIGLNIYPQLFATDLRLRLQSHVGYPADHILVTNGSDDALDLICKTYINEGDRVLSPYPTYTHFLLFAKSKGAIIDKVFFDDPFGANLDDVIEQVTPDTKIIYIVNPNNPTGSLFSNDELAEVAKAAPHAVILIDEAYGEFARQTACDLISRFENVAISRSFSKAYGLAALRVGYLIASPPIIEQLTRLYNPKSVNQMAQVAAVAVLDDLEYYERYIDEVDKSKLLMERWCGMRGLGFHNSPANFVMVKVPRVKEVVAKLAERGVYVRDRSSFPQLEDCFRLNLGTVEQSTKVLNIFESILIELGLLEENPET